MPLTTEQKEEIRYSGLSPEEQQRVRAHIYATSLKAWWSRDFGWICLLDPDTGEVVEVAWPHPQTPRWMAWRAMDDKQRRKPRPVEVRVPALW